MAIKPEEALEVFGLDPKELDKFDTADAFKTEVEKKWITRDAASKDKGITDVVFGKINRGLRKELSDINESLGLGLEDIDNKNPIDVLKMFPEAVKPKFDKIAELETKVKSAAPAEVVAKYEEEKKELDKKLKAFEKNAKEWETKYTTLDGEVKTREKSNKVNGEWDAALKAVQFAPTVDDLKKKGFISTVKEKYKVLIDDEGKIYAANDKEEPLMNPKKAAERWSLAEALKAEAEAMKLVGVNPQGGKPIIKPVVNKEAERPSSRFGIGARPEPARRLQ